MEEAVGNWLREYHPVFCHQILFPFFVFCFFPNFCYLSNLWLRVTCTWKKQQIKRQRDKKSVSSSHISNSPCLHFCSCFLQFTFCFSFFTFDFCFLIFAFCFSLFTFHFLLFTFFFLLFAFLGSFLLFAFHFSVTVFTFCFLLCSFHLHFLLYSLLLHGVFLFLGLHPVNINYLLSQSMAKRKQPRTLRVTMTQ